MQRPLTRKGAIRVELERRLRLAAGDGVCSLVVRAGDFFGPGTGNNWFSGAIVKPGKPLRTIYYPGKPGIGHQWAYVPDVAETMVRLLEQEEQLAPFSTYSMKGHWDADGTQMIASIRRVVNHPAFKVRAFPWWALPIMSPFSEMFRELLEMRYLWQQPIRMENTQVLATLGEEPRTPWDDAVRTTLTSMRCV